YEHSGTGDNWGVGIGILGSQNVTIENVNIQDFRGDGVYIGESQGASEDITLYNIVSDNNTRQGITIVDGDGIDIINSVFKNTNGSTPAAGINIEPNNGDLVTNVNIISSQSLNNEEYGLVISERASGVDHEINNVLVEGNQIIGNGFDVRINGVSDSQFFDNFIDGVDTALSDDGRVLASIIFNNETSGNTVSGNTVVTTGNEVGRADIDDRGQDNELYDNVVMGTDRDDDLKGGLGSEVINGGLGRDVLTGGDDADTFSFDSELSADNIDTIVDFSSDEGDKVALSEVVFGDVSLDKLENNWLVTDDEEVDSNTRIIQKGDDLYFDADGSGTDFSEVQFATVNQALTVDDFVVM
ncbi:right-handed parallel beta-helix repeat-containing protein, partial [Psychrobacter sp. AOP42-A1-21]